MDAKISSGSLIFLDAPLAQTPTNFGVKVVFGNYSQTKDVYRYQI